MGKRYERAVNERFGSNGKKLYREEYLLNRQMPLPSELFQYHCYMESVWYPGYEFVSAGISVCACHLIQHGRLKYANGGQTTIARPGDFVISRLPDGSRCWPLGDEALCRKGIHFARNPFAVLLLSALFPEQRTVIHLKDPENISDLLASLKRVILEDADDLDGVAHGLTFQTLYEAYRQHTQSGYPDELSKALQFINMREPEKISRNDIAARCGVSARTLTRLFQDHFNCAPGQYVLRNRLEQAKNMLSLHKISIKAIADLCGFCSAAHLTRMFRRQYGMSPLHYRKNAEIR